LYTTIERLEKDALERYQIEEMVTNPELLKRATLCITHAGLNTTLEALAQGVPLVAIPVGYDQPGVASRIAYHGVGEFVELGDLRKQLLSELIAKVTSNPSYRDRARWFQNVLHEKRGLDMAADIIEHVFGVAKRSSGLIEESLGAREKVGAAAGQV